jgi:hypothetical protein
MKKFIVMLRVVKEMIKMASRRGDCIHCGKVFHQLDEMLMDETPLMIMKAKKIRLFRKDLVFRNPAVTRILQDMINIMISMIFILVLLNFLGKDRQDFSLIGFGVLTHG